MRLKILLMAASLAASPAWARQGQPSPQPPAQGPSPQPATTPIVSLERIRSALEKPAPILAKMAGQKPDFAVHIEKRLPMADIFDTPPWATPTVGATQSVGINVLDLIRSAKRAHDAQAARDEASREIANYCAAQPNAGAGIAICSLKSAVVR